MQVDFDRLSQYHEAGKLRHSVYEGRNLHVWCYSQATVFTRDWDDLTRLCRGLVTDDQGNVISRPFPKFFNWGEPLAPGPEITNKPFWAFDKVDGTLIVVGLDEEGKAVVSTKGSFATWHSEAARDMLMGWTPVPGSTAIFELIHPQNRIVVDYGDREELVLLGAVANEDGCDHFTPENYAEESGWFGALCPPQAFHLPSLLRTVQDPDNGPNKEGFVLVWPNADGPSHRVKIKFAQYVQLHATLSRINNVAVWEALRNGTFDALLDIAPDEVYEKITTCSASVQDAVSRTLSDAKVTVETVQARFDNRKDQAAFILKHSDNPRLCFLLLDGKHDAARVHAYDLTKPARDETWTFLK